MIVLQFPQHLVHALEAPLPGPGEAAHPLVDRLERPAVDPVEPLSPLLAHAHQADLAQHPQVLGDQRLREAQRRDEIADGPLARGEDIQDLPPPGFGHRVERVGRRRRPSHAGNIYPYGHAMEGTTL
jgi:hypothetical protein